MGQERANSTCQIGSCRFGPSSNRPLGPLLGCRLLGRRLGLLGRFRCLLRSCRFRFGSSFGSGRFGPLLFAGLPSCHHPRRPRLPSGVYFFRIAAPFRCRFDNQHLRLLFCLLEYRLFYSLLCLLRLLHLLQHLFNCRRLATTPIAALAASIAPIAAAGTLIVVIAVGQLGGDVE